MATNKQIMEQVQMSMVQSNVRIIYQPKIRPSNRPVIRRSADAYKLFMESWDMQTIYLVEQAKLMLLNRANRLLGIMLLSTGGICGTVMDARIIFMATLNVGACSIIISHIHPSLNIAPSGNDKALTQKIKEAGIFLDIHLANHLIVSTDFIQCLMKEFCK